MSHSPIPTPHINAQEGAFAETVLMPGGHGQRHGHPVHRHLQL